MPENEIESPVPPDEWFTPAKRHGEISYTVNEEFMNQGEGKVGHHYRLWKHWFANSQDTPDVENVKSMISFVKDMDKYSGFEVTDHDDILNSSGFDSKKVIQDVIRQAEEVIKEQTGFSPRDIFNRLQELNKKN